VKALHVVIVVAALALTGCVASTPAPQREAAVQPAYDAMAVLPGVWVAQISNNYYQMRVNWNPSNARFEGILVRQGGVSQYVGFSIGELVWIAEPTQNPSVLLENQKWRYGMHGMSTSSKWVGGTVDLRRGGPGTLVTSTATFTRISN
jgi:hypothetical protein